MDRGPTMMMGEERTATIAEIESTIRRLRSVVSARVSGNERGEIEEIHVVSDDTRHPKQISRDIESLLLSELGLRFDHRIISIAQLREPNLLNSDARLKFLSIDLSLDRSDTEVRVNLGMGEDIFSGTARSSRHEAQLDAIAQATTAAVTSYLQFSSESDLATLEVRSVLRSVAPGVGDIITVVVRLSGPRGDEALVGSALVKENTWQAAAFATLDALNRRALRALN